MVVLETNKLAHIVRNHELRAINSAERGFDRLSRDSTKEIMTTEGERVVFMIKERLGRHREQGSNGARTLARVARSL